MCNWTPYVEDLDTYYHMEEKGSKVDKVKETSELTSMRVSLVWRALGMDYQDNDGK